jgi:hypothetical protein
LAKTSVSVTPAASIAALSLTPNLVIFARKDSIVKSPHRVEQDTEKKFSHFLSFVKFCFAAASPVAVPPLHNGLSESMSACRKARKFLIHISSVPFFKREVTGNSTRQVGLFK